MLASLSDSSYLSFFSHQDWGWVQKHLLCLQIKHLLAASVCTLIKSVYYLQSFIAACFLNQIYDALLPLIETKLHTYVLKIIICNLQMRKLKHMEIKQLYLYLLLSLLLCLSGWSREQVSQECEWNIMWVRNVNPGLTPITALTAQFSFCTRFLSSYLRGVERQNYFFHMLGYSCEIFRDSFMEYWQQTGLVLVFFSLVVVLYQLIMNELFSTAM